MLQAHDLTFWPYVTGPSTSSSSIWTGLPGDTPGELPVTWLWTPRVLLIIPGTLDHVNQLAEAGWERLPERYLSQSDMRLLYHVWGQLGDFRAVQWPGGQAQEVWVPSADLRQVNTYQVALAFRLSALPDGAHPIQHPDTRMQTVHIANVLPPPELGTIGLVYVEPIPGKGRGKGKGEEGWKRYSIDALGEETQSLQRRLGEALRELAAPADWWPLSDMLVACTDPGYRTTQSLLQSRLLASRGEMREVVRAQLDELETAHGWQLALRAAPKRHSPDEWLEKWGQIRSMAQQLAAAYGERHQEVTAEEARVATRRGQITQLPLSGLSDGLLGIPTEVPIQAFLNAYSQASSMARKGPAATLPKVTPDLATATGGWTHHGPSGLPVFVHETEKYRTEVHMVDPDGAEDAAKTHTREELSELAAHVWAQVAVLDDLDGDILLARLAHFLAAPKDENGRTWITAEHVLRYRGREAKTNHDGKYEWDGGMRREDMAVIGAHSARLDTQWVTISKRAVAGGDLSWKSKLFLVAEKLTYRQLVNTPEAAMMDTAATASIELPAGVKVTGRALIEATKDATKDLPAGSAIDFDIAWLYQPGTWWQGIEYDDAGRVHMERLSQRILMYDPYHEQWEKRLARYAFFHLRMNATKGQGTIKRRIRDLLTDLGLEVDERHPADTRERFEKAMNNIKADGCIEHWDYAAGKPVLPARKWLEVWLDLQVKMLAPPLVREHYAKMAADRAALIAQLHPTRRNQKRARDAAGDTPSPRRKGGK